MKKVTDAEIMNRLKYNKSKYGGVKLNKDIIKQYKQFKLKKLWLHYDWHPTIPGKVVVKRDFQNFCIVVCITLTVCYLILTCLSYNYFHDTLGAMISASLSILPIALLLMDLDRDDLCGTVLFNVGMFFIIFTVEGCRYYA